MAKYNCLVVEDSPMMRQLLVLALSRITSLKVMEADDGLVGMKMLAAQKFDIVIVDINMPIMDGLKLIKHIRSDKVHSDVPVIIVTTEGGIEDRQRATQGHRHREEAPQDKSLDPRTHVFLNTGLHHRPSPDPSVERT